MRERTELLRDVLGKDRQNDMERQMQTAFRFVVAALALGFTSAGALGVTCTLYDNRDFGGSHYVLHGGDDLQMINPPSIGTSDGIHRFLYNRSWNDHVSSFKVDKGCTLTLWENVNQGGHHFRSNRSYSYLGGAWSDKTSEASCDCGVTANF